ncbi:hypothetical protein [Blastococcus sp. SYSU D00820]
MNGRRTVALAAGLLLTACGAPAAPDDRALTGDGGPVPAGPFAAVLDDAALDDAAEGLIVVRLAGGPGAVHVLGRLDFDYDGEDPPPACWSPTRSATRGSASRWC